ncbi:META domain-containing protein [Paracoccus albus]|uniref:META domain-containing protein n=1 Tax=Paracoccus albus TaxID=3017784 RepID=UPI0022F0FBE1|nr:META domain-containing protein [Paracoccus albus]WBU60803.1 META domain-containing protein [Paracoccus albus]
MTQILRFVAFALLAGCTAPALPEDERIDGIDWILTEVNGLPWVQDVSLRLDDDRLTGVGPCNAYSGRREGTAPAFGALDLSSTSMACADAARMQAEAEYLNMLRQAISVRRDHGQLVLNGPGLMMVFERREARGDEVF